MNIMDDFKSTAKLLNNRIVLPEGSDQRIIEAVVTIYKEKLSKLILLGKKDILISKLEIESGNSLKNIDEDRLQIIDPESDSRLSDFTSTYYNMRKSKGMTEEEAVVSMKNPLFFGAMLVKKKLADGMVAGAMNTTSDVLRAGLRIVGVKEGIKTVSSFFILITPFKEFGINGILLFADSAVNPDPDAETLADIAIATAESCKKLLNVEPKVALLSFSTKGSASTPSVDKVINAVDIVKSKRPDITIDGEMQLDAAIIPSVADIKAPGSNVAGKANVLIFPNLESANIGYKLVERFSSTVAVGPVIQGLASPINDLSRGCSSNDIVNVVAITATQAG